jgi:hypothetical protein
MSRKDSISELKRAYTGAYNRHVEHWYKLTRRYTDHPLVTAKPTMKTIRRDAAWTDEQLQNAMPHDLVLETRFLASMIVIATDYDLQAAMTYKLSEGNIDPRKPAELYVNMTAPAEGAA